MSMDVFFACLMVWVVVAIFGFIEAMIEYESKGWAVAAMLWPITLILLSPVLLVKLFAVTFKRRGLLSSWLGVIADTYKGAVK